jgi:hypothetical protein
MLNHGILKASFPAAPLSFTANGIAPKRVSSSLAPSDAVAVNIGDRSQQFLSHSLATPPLTENRFPFNPPTARR